MGFFRRRGSDASADPGVFDGLRSRVFTISPASIGIQPSDPLPTVWGGVMELGMPEANATIVSLADGTTSMYLSTGGGVIGGGEHEQVAEASISFLRQLEADRDLLPSDESLDLPPPGSVCFFALTYHGRQRRSEPEDAVSTEDHPLFRLYAAGQDVITALRETTTRLER
jgi:hypothetical protein